MNIYIYGNKSFRNEVHNELDHSNIKFRLDDESSIIELTDPEELRRVIETRPNDVFLIDDAKIIKKEGLQSKIKFLRPKDGIEDTFLYEHGVGDISFDSIEELSKHVISKIEDDEFMENRDEIQDSIADIVQDAYDGDTPEDEIQLDQELSQLLSSNEVDEEEPTKSEEEDLDEEFENFDPDETSLDELESEFNFDEGLKDIGLEPIEDEEQMASSVEDKDFLKELEELEGSEFSKPEDISDELQNMEVEEDFLKELQDLEEESSSEVEEEPIDLNETLKEEVEVKNSEEPTVVETPNDEPSSLFGDMDLEQALDGLEISNEDFGGSPTVKQNVTNDDLQGELSMLEDFSSLDEIKESDIIAALNGEEIVISDSAVLKSSNDESKEQMSLNISNADDISALLAQLLKNKTLEITVKVKE